LSIVQTAFRLEHVAPLSESLGKGLFQRRQRGKRLGRRLWDAQILGLFTQGLGQAEAGKLKRPIGAGLVQTGAL
jgi:hypothetical protein